MKLLRHSAVVALLSKSLAEEENAARLLNQVARINVGGSNAVGDRASVRGSLINFGMPAYRPAVAATIFPETDGPSGSNQASLHRQPSDGYQAASGTLPQPGNKTLRSGHPGDLPHPRADRREVRC
jgi:hypothetical protein